MPHQPSLHSKDQYNLFAEIKAKQNYCRAQFFNARRASNRINGSTAIGSRNERCDATRDRRKFVFFPENSWKYLVRNVVSVDDELKMHMTFNKVDEILFGNFRVTFNETVVDGRQTNWQSSKRNAVKKENSRRNLEAEQKWQLLKSNLHFQPENDQFVSVKLGKRWKPKYNLIKVKLCYN